MKNQTLYAIGFGALLLSVLAKVKQDRMAAQSYNSDPIVSVNGSLTRPTTIYDYFGSRSAAEVLANPGPMFARDVLGYPDEAARGSRAR